MYRLFVGLVVVMIIELWSGVAAVHAVKLDIKVKAVEGTRDDPVSKFIVTNTTRDFSVKAFAVTLGNALTAETTRSMWDAFAQEVNPIPGLPGSGGGVDDPVEYVFYKTDDPSHYLMPGEEDDSFTFTLFGSLREPFSVGILAVDMGGNEVTCIGSGDTDCQVLPNLTSPFTALGPATFWIGLKNSDDQGTQFDLRAEIYINDPDTGLVSSGEMPCITGVTRNPNKAKEVTLTLVPSGISDGTFLPGDRLFLTISTRIGTSPSGKCSGPGGSHNNAVGLRLYYDAGNRPSRLGVATALESLQDFFLHSYDGDFLDNARPTATAVHFKDSGSVNFAGGNRWQIIGTWSIPLP